MAREILGRLGRFLIDFSGGEFTPRQKSKKLYEQTKAEVADRLQRGEKIVYSDLLRRGLTRNQAGFIMKEIEIKTWVASGYTQKIESAFEQPVGGGRAVKHFRLVPTSKE